MKRGRTLYENNRSVPDTFILESLKKSKCQNQAKPKDDREKQVIFRNVTTQIQHKSKKWRPKGQRKMYWEYFASELTNSNKSLKLLILHLLLNELWFVVLQSEAEKLLL